MNETEKLHEFQTDGHLLVMKKKICEQGNLLLRTETHREIVKQNLFRFLKIFLMMTRFAT